MPVQETHIRKVVKGDKQRVYAKLFDKTEKGYKAAELYSKDEKTSSISGETLKCIIDKKAKTIQIRTNTDFPIKNIKVIGTSTLTKLKGTYNNSGSFTRGFGDVIKSILVVIPNIKNMIIDFDLEAKSKLEKRGGNNILTISAFDYNYINGLFSAEKKASNDNSQFAALKYLGSKISTLPAPFGKKGKEMSEAFKKQVHEEVINNFDENELEKLLFQIYNKYFYKLKNKLELFKKTDTRKLEYVIQEFDLHFTNCFSDEKKWQALFEQYYRVINPNYKYVIREVDTIFESLDIEASSRPVDFIGIDIYNNLELVELKTPGATILSTKKDHNNYCLTYNCTKACTQIEKYLTSLEANKISVEKLVKEKISKKYGIKVKDINVAISKPKAKLIIGMLEPLLNKPARHADFQLQRHSFKNIEIITFDEIYSSLVEIKTELAKKLKKK